MGVQFGTWRFDDQPVTLDRADEVLTMLQKHGPDGDTSYSDRHAAILYSAFHNTKESQNQRQPYISRSGAIIAWDGRLDNRTELMSQLDERLPNDCADVSIAAAAFERWGVSCFAKLIGDWALSIWAPSSRGLILAKDPMGTRPLYYSIERDRIRWSSVLETLVLLASETFELNEEYIAGWLSVFPLAHLTPYKRIFGVPPSTYVLIRSDRHEATKYWDFQPDRHLPYRSDADYEEAFRRNFEQSVKWRLRSEQPVVSELSGGMDSSSIVCVADRLIAAGHAETPRLDTVSYHSDFEPNWDEKPYFTRIEQMRGHEGHHIDVARMDGGALDPDQHDFWASPNEVAFADGFGGGLATCMTETGSRVLLSGIGGDEVTGGVANPGPGLQDLLARGRIGCLFDQLVQWALVKRKPCFQLLRQTAEGFLPAFLQSVPEVRRPAPWLDSKFVRRNFSALTGYERRLHFFGSLPSFQENLATLESLRRQLASEAMPCDPAYDKRYPYLDRNLLEFLFSVPREQIVRPGQRRSLMRRALSGIVPDEILNRKRKAFVVRGTISRALNYATRLAEPSSDMVLAAIGIVDPKAISNAIHKARQGEEINFVGLLRTLGVEAWLRQINAFKHIVVI
jgi:asparagine synthase (glutamine-hydrolysing)